MTDRQLTLKSGACPKAVWVMSTLSDDELIDGAVELPTGLAFHLNRCASCRSLAEGLQAVSRGLHALSLAEPADDLEDQANAQLVRALANGAQLSGRVRIPADEEFDSPSVQTLQRRWLDWGNLAVAAVVTIVAVGVYASYRLTREPKDNMVHQLNPLPTYQTSTPGNSDKSPFTDPENSQLADSAKPSSGQATQPRRHHTHIEAADSDDKSAVQYGVVLPDPATRGVTIVPWFDKPAQTESNKPFQTDN